MALPLDLRDYLILRLEKVRQDPQHRLKPYYRLALYNKIRTYSENFAQKLLAHLQIITIAYLSPLWQEEMLGTPYQTMPELTLSLAEDLLDGKISPDCQTLDYLKKLEAQIQQYYYQSSPVVSVRTKYIATALIQCLQTTDIYPFTDLNTPKGQYIIDANHEDSLYLGMGGDIAATALIVTAGTLQANQWSSAFDPQKSLAFWVWWLTKAIPQAWEHTERKESKGTFITQGIAQQISRQTEKLPPDQVAFAWIYHADRPEIEIHNVYGKHTTATVTKVKPDTTYCAIITANVEAANTQPKVLATKANFPNLGDAKLWCEEHLI
jgi:hypothetical protein